MLLAVVPVGRMSLPGWQILFLQAAVGVTVYVLSCVVLRIPAFFRMLELAKRFIRK